MQPPISILLHPEAREQPRPKLRLIPREDVLWNRPVFKAPPLQISSPAFDAAQFGQEVRRDYRVAS